MTLPDQPGGTSLDFGLLGSLFGVSGADGSIPLLSSLTQPFVESALKSDVQSSPGWLGANDAAYGGLLPGIALIPNLLMNIVTSIIGLPFGTWPGDGPGGFLGEVPNILSDLGNFFFNLTGIFGGDVDLNSLIFDPIQAVFDFVTTMILPTDLLASLIGGLIPGLQIPGLDASKITSGFFPMDMISGLLEMLSSLPVVGPIFSMIDALGFIPTSLLGGGGSGNLLKNPVFVDGALNWTGDGVWDSTSGHDNMGSLKIIADGTLQFALSEFIPVTAGQQINTSAWTKWSGLTGSGTPAIFLSLNTYDSAHALLGEILVGGGINFSASGGWSQITGTPYQVTSGVAFVKLKPNVAATVTAGSVWIDDASVSKGGGIVDSLVPGLGGIIDTLIGAFTGSGAGLGGLLSVFTDVFGLLGGPAGVGTGSPILPGLSSIPILGPLLSGGNILSSIIPGLDASKIISGFFPMDMISGLLSFFTGFGGAGSLLEQLVSAITGGDGAGGLLDLIGFGFLGNGSPLDALNLFNIIPSNLLGLIGFGQIGDTQPNLLANGTFESAISVQGSGIWTWDGTTGRTANGCASITANGSEQRLLSNAIPVAEGDKLSHIIRAKWSGLAYTGTPFRTRMVRMLNHAQVGIDNLAAPTTPGATQTTWVDLTGADYTVPAGCDAVCYELTITATATAGTVKWDDGEVRKTGLLKIPWMQDLPSSLSDLVDFGQSTLDAVFEGITGINRVGSLFGDIIDSLKNIPFGNIGGVAGPPNIGGSVLSVIDQLVSSFVGAIGTGASLADVFNLGSDISSRASKGRDSFDILGIRNNQGLNTGFLPTTQSNIGLDKIALQATAPTFGITQSTAITAYHVIEKSGLKGVVSWQGYGITSITHCFINIYKMNTTTGVNALVHESTNQVGLLSGGSTPVPVVYSFTPIQTEPGEVYGIEIAVRGAGTHNIAGAASWLQDQTVYPRRYSSVRDSGTSAAPSSFTPTYGTNVPFVEFGVSASAVAIPHSPITESFLVPQTATAYVFPGWANSVEVVELPGGGGGYVGSGPPTMGEGGHAGSWQTTTWTRGTHFDAATNPSLSVTVGDGGDGSSSPSTAGSGQNSSVTLPATTGHSAVTLTATGGLGGDEWVSDTADRHGDSPGNTTYGGVPYNGGLAQTTGSAVGNAPGGGGSGGNTSWGLSVGKKGAPGAVWLRFKQ